MAEHVLMGPINIAGDEAGARHLIVHDTGGEVYRVPMDAEGARKIGETLQLDDEALQEMSERAAAASRLVVPGKNGHDVHGHI
jgi:hypothetical protein